MTGPTPKTFLVIDARPLVRNPETDDRSLAFKPEKAQAAFAEAEIKAMFEVKPHGEEALAIIEKWKKLGCGLDVLTCNMGKINFDNEHAIYFRDLPPLRDVLLLNGLLCEVTKEFGDAMLPKQVFFHSSAPYISTVQTELGEVSVLNDLEITALMLSQGVFHSSYTSIEESKLLAYLDQHWGTKFKMSQMIGDRVHNLHKTPEYS